MAEKNGKRFDSIRFIAYLCTFKPTKKKNEEVSAVDDCCADGLYGCWPDAAFLYL